MAKTKEQLQELKQQYDELNDKLKELSEEELQEVTGGVILGVDAHDHNVMLSD